MVDLVAETYAAFVMLHSLGFPQEALRVVEASVLNGIPRPGEAVCVQLHRDGDCVFTITCSRTDVDLREFESIWRRFVDERKALMTDAELDAMVAETDIRRGLVGLIGELVRRGLIDEAGKAVWV